MPVEKKGKKMNQHQPLIGLCFSFVLLFSLFFFFLKGFSLCALEGDESERSESLHTSSLASECQNICYGFVLKPWQMGEGKV